MTTPVHLGVSLSPGNATWEELRDGARLVDSLGYDSLWSPDHFLTSATRPDGPYLEAWQVLAAWAATTTRVRLGPLVTPIDFRHPAVLAKMAVALDHISGGRAILGLGAGWYEQEYGQFGLSFGTPGERLARLSETIQICRSLFEQKKTSFEGRFYRLRSARAEPKPVQSRLPILVGADGDRALRLVARYADWWNGFGTPEDVRRKLGILRSEANAAKRAPEAVVPSVTFRPLVVRDRPEDVEARNRLTAERHGLATPDTQWMLAGAAERVAARLREYIALGVRTFIVQQRVPWDRESLERLARDVRPLLD